MYTFIAAYFKHPELICSPVGSKGVSPGRGLYIQMSHDPENEYLHIPKEERHLPSVWKKGNCLPMMGWYIVLFVCLFFGLFVMLLHNVNRSGKQL